MRAAGGCTSLYRSPSVHMSGTSASFIHLFTKASFHSVERWLHTSSVSRVISSKHSERNAKNQWLRGQREREGKRESEINRCNCMFTGMHLSTSIRTCIMYVFKSESENVRWALAVSSHSLVWRSFGMVTLILGCVLTHKLDILRHPPSLWPEPDSKYIEYETETENSGWVAKVEIRIRLNFFIFNSFWHLVCMCAHFHINSAKDKRPLTFNRFFQQIS